jgi:hypothetical protein
VQHFLLLLQALDVLQFLPVLPRVAYGLLHARALGGRLANLTWGQSRLNKFKQIKSIADPM